MNRVIVCKLGRFGELRKIVDFQTNQLSEGKSDEQNTHDSQYNSVILTNESQSNSFVTSVCQSNSLVTSESQSNSSVSSDSHLTSQVSQSSIISQFNQSSGDLEQNDQQGGFGSFEFNINQNFEGCIFETDMGKNYYI